MANSRQEPPHHQPSHPVNPYTAYDTYCARFPDLSMTVDTKQRKRRGNLPKETTDKLRAWFMAHLAHPYPTEDEKQELMRQTGLQMSKYPLPCGVMNDGGLWDPWNIITLVMAYLVSFFFFF